MRSVQASANRWWPWWWFDMKEEKRLKAIRHYMRLKCLFTLIIWVSFPSLLAPHQETINMFHCWLDSVGSSLKASTQSVKIVFFSLECSLLPPPSKQRQQSGFSIEKRRFATQHEGERGKEKSCCHCFYSVGSCWGDEKWSLESFTTRFFTATKLSWSSITRPGLGLCNSFTWFISHDGGDFVWCLGWRCRENRLSANLKKKLFLYENHDFDLGAVS